MTKFEKPSKELEDMLDNLVISLDCTKRKMFGCPCFFVNGNMYSGVFEDTIFLRFSISEQKELKKHFDGINQFEPIKGRKMKEYITISENIWQNIDTVKELLTKSYSYVSSLPVKEKKKHK